MESTTTENHLSTAETPSNKLKMFLIDVYKSPLYTSAQRYKLHEELRSGIKFNSISSTGRILQMSDNPYIIEEDNGVLAKGAFEISGINWLGDKPEDGIMFDLKGHTTDERQVEVTGTLVGKAATSFIEITTTTNKQNKIPFETDLSPNRYIGDDTAK